MSIFAPHIQVTLSDVNNQACETCQATRPQMKRLRFSAGPETPLSFFFKFKIYLAELFNETIQTFKLLAGLNQMRFLVT